MKKDSILVLLRHGESEWNRKNLFTGWVDVPLSQEGIEEAKRAGKRFSSIPFDIVFMSSLIRSKLTAMIAMSEHRQGKTPVVLHSGEGRLEEWGKNSNPRGSETTIPAISAWEINERMYGDLQGLDKDETRKKFGVDQVKIWRRSYDVSPPNGESLEMTAKRSIPYFQNQIFPYVKRGKNVLVSAHGNSLRSIVMFLEDLSKEEVLKLEIPTGEPLCYIYEGGSWKKEEIDHVQRAYQKGS